MKRAKKAVNSIRSGLDRTASVDARETAVKLDCEKLAGMVCAALEAAGFETAVNIRAERTLAGCGGRTCSERLIEIRPQDDMAGRRLRAKLVVGPQRGNNHWASDYTTHVGAALSFHKFGGGLVTARYTTHRLDLVVKKIVAAITEASRIFDLAIADRAARVEQTQIQAEALVENFPEADGWTGAAGSLARSKSLVPTDGAADVRACLSVAPNGHGLFGIQLAGSYLSASEVRQLAAFLQKMVDRAQA
jgi:hypothetical protein